MKPNYLILVLIIFIITSITEASAQESKGSVLCRLNVSSMMDPVGFDDVIYAERGNFDNAMFTYIQTHINTLSHQADQHDAGCEIYRNNPMQYTQCKGSQNVARWYVVWLGNVLEAVGGTSWSQTIIGLDQIKGMQICKTTGIFDCIQFQHATAAGYRQICPAYLGK